MRSSKLFDEAQELLNRLYKGSFETRQKIKIYHEYLDILRKAAYNGVVEAQFALGQNYEDMNFWGENPYYSDKKRFYWYSKAAKGGHAEACNNLAVMYERGLGVEKNIDLALKYYRKAAELGSTMGKENLELFLSQLGEKELEK